MKKDQLPKNGVPYLEAFPFYHSILDSCHLEKEEQEFARLLSQQLIQGTMDVTFQGHAQYGDKLHHLHFESRNWERQAGQRCSAFGFPLLLSKQQSSVRLAPLFYWPVSLDPDPHRPNYWTLRSIPGRAPLLNPLLPLLQIQEDPMPAQPWSSGAIPSVEDIQSFGKKLAGWLATTWQDNWNEPFPIPPLEVLGDLADQRVILPCMVFGAFKPAFLPGEENQWSVQEDLAEKGEGRQPFERSLFSPFQAMAWERAHEGRTTLIEAKNEQQTREWVLNLVHNALCNGERCLVLSDRLGRLSQFQATLSTLGLDWLSFVLKDPGHDAYLLAELLKARANKEENGTPFPRNEYNMALAKGKRQKERLDRAYQALQKSVFGTHSWTGLTGLFLRSSSIEGKELLSNQLTTQDFNFHYTEYEELKQSINRSIPLYNQINTLKHPLAALHPSLFLNYEKAPCLERIKGSIGAFTERLEKLNHEVLRQTDAYALKLNDHFEQGFLSLNARLQQVQELYSDYSHKFGEAFEKTGASAIRIRGLFNNRTKALKHAQEEVTQSYQALARRHQEHNYFEMKFLSSSDSKNMVKVRENLDHFQRALGDWRQHIRDRVLEEVARLNQQTVYAELGFQERTAQLEDTIHQTLAAFNEAEIYGETVEANMLTIPKKQKFLDSLLEKLETTRLNLRDFDPFYDWQRNWLQLTEPQQRLLRALIKVKPQHWISAFESWYFHHCLTRNFSDDLPTDDQALRVFNEAWTSLQDFLPGLIQSEWLERQQQALKNWKKHHKQGYQAWLGKGKREGAPQDWYSGNWEFIHDLFPVWMLSDSLASALYQAENCPDLDWVIVWEHQDFEPSLWEKLANKVKRWVFIGNPTGKAWADLQEKGWPVYTIDPLPPTRIPERLSLSEDDRKTSGSFQVVPVSGLFDQSRHTNEAEAQEILRLLNEVRPTPARTYPSVAILALTVEQRDLIATYLLQIKQRNLQGSEKIRSLERNGLAVLHIDEFLGSSFDQYLFSTTFGPVNVQGALSNDIAYFGSSGWMSAAKALEQASFQSGIWLHSFTEGHLTDPKLRALSGFLKNLGVSELAVSEKSPLPFPPFNQEVQAMLHSYFDEWRFEQVPPTEICYFPVLLRHEKKPPFTTAVVSDLFVARTPNTSYTWEWEVRQLLEANGAHVQNAWSVLCWRNPRQEARKIASRIITTYNRLIKDEARATPAPEEEKTEEPAADSEAE